MLIFTTAFVLQTIRVSSSFTHRKQKQVRPLTRVSAASYPGQFALSELSREGLEPSAIARRIFPTSLTGDVTSEIAEDDWERGWCFSTYN